MDRELMAKVGEILEGMRCAEINFTNLKNSAPLIGTHPFFQIAMMQLQGAIKIAEGVCE